MAEVNPVTHQLSLSKNPSFSKMGDGVKILIQGYARQVNGSEFASSTVTLIKEGKFKVIVDPGMDRRLLLQSLKKENLSFDEIDYVILTHYHLDHCLLTGIFGRAKILDNSDIYHWNGKIEAHMGKIPLTSIKIIKTPGHDPFHCSVIVGTKKFGIVVIAGDVFWWSDKEKQKTDRASLVAHPDPYLKNKKELSQSRKKVLELADYVIPGHGPMFPVRNKKLISQKHKSTQLPRH